MEIDEDYSQWKKCLQKFIKSRARYKHVTSTEPTRASSLSVLTITKGVNCEEIYTCFLEKYWVPADIHTFPRLPLNNLEKSNDTAPPEDSIYGLLTTVIIAMHFVGWV